MSSPDSETGAQPIRVFHLHKEGELAKDYQDAFAHNIEKRRFALADGATMDFFSGVWAELLVEQFCAEGGTATTKLFANQDWLTWINPVRQRWHGRVAKIVEDVDPKKGYFLINRFNRRDPGTATFAGLQLSEVSDGKLTWSALLIGDACLFHISGKDVTSYLLQTADEFDYHPDVFSSIDNGQSYQPVFQQGEAQASDFFILASDAIAKWLLEVSAQMGWPDQIKWLRQIKSQEAFEAFITKARGHSEFVLENDDVTLALISAKPTEPLADPSHVMTQTAVGNNGRAAQTPDFDFPTIAVGQDDSELQQQLPQVSTDCFDHERVDGQKRSERSQRRLIILAGILITIFLLVIVRRSDWELSSSGGPTLQVTTPASNFDGGNRQGNLDEDLTPLETPTLVVTPQSPTPTLPSVATTPSDSIIATPSRYFSCREDAQSWGCP